MPEISLSLPDILSKRLQSEADVHGIPPELMAVYIIARALREEKQPQVIIPPQFLMRPETPPAPETPADEDKYVAANQRMFAMNIASNLMAIGENAGKTPDDVWSKFDEFYIKVHDKMIKDTTLDGMEQK